MQNKLEKYLYKKYPDLFKNQSKSMKETCMCWGCSCGDGWLQILDVLCSNISRHIRIQNEQMDLYDESDAKKLANGETIEERPAWAKERITPVHFEQIKEKFGSLRIYYTGGDDVIRSWIDFAESLSTFICEDCGKFDLTVGMTTKGWLHVICEECASKEKDYKKDTGWTLHKSNRDAAKAMKQAIKDREKQKGKETELAKKRFEEIQSRDEDKKTKD